MEENFNLAAQSRANYYTPGSPVQFVRVELLKGEQSGDNAVCLTFKNIGDQTITGLDVRFKCKAANGELLCEETFNYEELNAGRGELFGMDDAVFITDKAIGSVAGDDHTLCLAAVGYRDFAQLQQSCAARYAFLYQNYLVPLSTLPLEDRQTRYEMWKQYRSHYSRYLKDGQE